MATSSYDQLCLTLYIRGHILQNWPTISESLMKLYIERSKIHRKVIWTIPRSRRQVTDKTKKTNDLYPCILQRCT